MSAPRFRGLGLGQALMAELARICIDRGYARLEWWVLDWNTPAIDFYRSLGAQSMDEWTVNRITGTHLERWPSALIGTEATPVTTRPPSVPPIG